MSEAGSKEWPLITIQVKPAEEGHLKIAWGSPDEAQWPAYLVDRVRITNISGRLRAAVAELVQAMIEPRGRSQKAILASIAAQGRKLRKALFTSSVPYNELPDRIQAWLAALEGPHRLVFVVDGYTHVPWGLICEADAEDPGCGEGDDSSLIEAFWAFRHKVSCIYSRLTPRVGSTLSGFRLLPVLHEQEFARSIGSLGEEERSTMLAFLERHGGAIHSSAALFTKWRETQGCDRLLLFVGHANGRSLGVGPEDVITTDVFEEELDADVRSYSGLSFSMLNGCFTAVAEKGMDGFLSVTSRPGFCGFVGTETEIPNVYALRFGTSLVRHAIATGEPMVEVLDVMRRRHWPLSLAYGMYGYGLFKVDALAGDDEWITHQSANFSAGPLVAR